MPPFIRPLWGGESTPILAPDMLAYWNYETEAPVGNYANATGNTTYDMAKIGSASLVTGKVSNALNIPGGGAGYTRLAPTPSIPFAGGSGDWSFTYWVRQDTLIANCMFLTMGLVATAANSDYAIGFNGAHRPAISISNGTSWFTIDAGGTPVTAGQWNFVAAYHDISAKEIGISINGNAFNTTNYTGTANSAGGNELNLGFARTNGIHPDGAADEAVWYSDKVLTPDEVTWIYNGGAGRAYADYE